MKPFELPRGVSGLDRDHQPSESVLTAFTAALDLLDLELVGRYEARSYTSALVMDRGEEWIILCNRFAGFVAFGKVGGRDESGKPLFTFADHEQWMFFFTAKGFQVLDTQWLGLVMDGDIAESAAFVRLLSDVEFAEFSFWEPRTMADIVFNDWA